MAANDMVTHRLDPDALGHDEGWKGGSNAQGGLQHRGWLDACPCLKAHMSIDTPSLVFPIPAARWANSER
jgi:hypothetical protein